MVKEVIKKKAKEALEELGLIEKPKKKKWLLWAAAAGVVAYGAYKWFTRDEDDE